MKISKVSLLIFVALQAAHCFCDLIYSFFDDVDVRRTCNAILFMKICNCKFFVKIDIFSCKRVRLPSYAPRWRAWG